jgi:hypothetical protein
MIGELNKHIRDVDERRAAAAAAAAAEAGAGPGAAESGMVLVLEQQLLELNKQRTLLLQLAKPRG